MLDSIDIKKVKYILEPLAGKGDIIDEIKEKYDNCYGYRYSKSDVDIDAIEVDDNLRLLLKGKEYKVVHNDFLKFNTYKKYDLIVMNLY